MGEMMERIARAIRDACGCGLSVDGEYAFCDDPRASPDIRQTGCVCKSGALAAVEAMREPSQAMIDAASFDYEMDENPDGITASQAKDAWQSAIDALLTEGGRTGEGE